MANESSLERAFRDECEGGAVLGADAEPNLLDGLRGEDGKLPANVFQLVRQGEAKRAGRPAGAGNKRNRKLAQLVCQQHGDPVMFMASLYSMPLDQLVELLRITDDADEREARLFALADGVENLLVQLLRNPGGATKENLRHFEGLVDRLTDLAKVLRTKPGDLAVKALAQQIVAAREVAQYVHSKQPVDVKVSKKSDVTIIIPGLNAPIMDPKELERRIRAEGLDVLDYDNLELLPAPEGDRDGGDVE